MKLQNGLRNMNRLIDLLNDSNTYCVQHIFILLNKKFIIYSILEACNIIQTSFYFVSFEVMYGRSIKYKDEIAISDPLVLKCLNNLFLYSIKDKFQPISVALLRKEEPKFIYRILIIIKLNNSKVSSILYYCLYTSNFCERKKFA